ncbi:hypothetical protein C0J52_18585 [Blattella germanica]|nr:hypothetical protein C0J52_18585 [Blattella germanica]
MRPPRFQNRTEQNAELESNHVILKRILLPNSFSYPATQYKKQLYVLMGHSEMGLAVAKQDCCSSNTEASNIQLKVISSKDEFFIKNERRQFR